MLSSGPFKRMASSLYNLCAKPLVSGVYSLSILRLYGGLMFRLGFILWLLANNKTLTRSNLSKRQHLEDLSCLFCGETETVHHLFFGCCVTTSMWCHLSESFDTNLGVNFESVARWWISNKKNAILNTCCAALMWCIWKMRNDMCRQNCGEARTCCSS